MQRYFALLDRGPGAYGIAFPDCPGCTAMGVRAEEAFENAVVALGEWIRDARAVGIAPKARGIEALRADDEVSEALAEGAALLSVPVVIEPSA